MTDLAPGVEVEMYRGTEDGPFWIGARFVVTRLWDAGPEWEPCLDCLPGWTAPCIELAGVAPHPLGLPLCGCTFRPVRRPTNEIPQALTQPAPAREPEPA